ELACAKGHVYPLLLVRLALTWACEAHTSYRGIALIFASLRGVVAAVGPCAETIRLWLLRVGLFLLRRPLPRCLDWVFLVDLTIQLGTHKCLVILGVPLSQLRRTGYSPDHHDVHVLSLHVLTRCNGTIVSGHLSTVSKRVGVPVQIVSDHGSDVLAGIRLFRQKNRHVVETYDITHGLAILLKNQLEPDPCWTSFVKACQSTRQQLQQAVGSFLQPPAWRSKARFLNLESHLGWANDMLALLCGGVEGTLAEQLGRVESHQLAENQAPLDRRKQTDWEGEGISTTGIGVCAEGRGEGASQAAIPGKHGRAGVVVWQVQRFGRTRSVSGDHGERVDDSTVGDSIDARAPSPGIRDRP